MPFVCGCNLRSMLRTVARVSVATLSLQIDVQLKGCSGNQQSCHESVLVNACEIVHELCLRRHIFRRCIVSLAAFHDFLLALDILDLTDVLDVVSSALRSS